MTLPSLVANYRKKVTATQLKQTYAILTNAIYKQQTLSGIPFSFYYALEYRKDVCPTGYEFKECSTALFEDYLKDNLSENVKVLDGAFGDYFYPNSHAAVLYGKAFILPNGVGVNIYNGYFAVIPNYKFQKDYRKRPNIVPGKNVFLFGAPSGTFSALKDISGLLPMKKSAREKLTRDDLIERCQSTNRDTSMVACTQLFIEDDFEFKKDYPIGF